MTRETIIKALQIVEDRELDSQYGYIGIRTQEQPYTLGEIAHCSAVWCEGEMTDGLMDGICATSLTVLDRIKDNKRALEHVNYYGDHIAIICGNRAEMGEDLGELVIEDAVVVAILA